MSRALLPILAALALAGAGACASPDGRQEARLRAAEQAAADGDLERAAEILRAARAFDPRDWRIVARLAEVHEQGGAPGRALRLLDGFPGEVREPRWLNLRARLLLRCGRVAEGGRLARSLERRGLADEETLGALGEVLELARTSDNRSFVRKVDDLSTGAGSPPALLVRRRRLELEGRTAEVARLDRGFLARFPDDPRRGVVLAAQARRELVRGELARAVALADEALALDGERAGVLVLRGLALEWSGRSQEGRAALRLALALEPDNREAREALRATDEGKALLLRVETP